MVDYIFKIDYFVFRICPFRISICEAFLPQFNDDELEQLKHSTNKQSIQLGRCIIA